MRRWLLPSLLVLLSALALAGPPQVTTTSGTSPGGAASGDLSGTYPSPTVAKVNGTTLGAAFLALLNDETAGDLRTSLGLGTVATQAASAVSFTGGSATGLTSLGVTGQTWSVATAGSWSSGDTKTLATLPAVDSTYKVDVDYMIVRQSGGVSRRMGQFRLYARRTSGTTTLHMSADNAQGGGYAPMLSFAASGDALTVQITDAGQSGEYAFFARTLSAGTDLEG